MGELYITVHFVKREEKPLYEVTVSAPNFSGSILSKCKDPEKGAIRAFTSFLEQFDSQFELRSSWDRTLDGRSEK